jgi:hypothetical protein
MTEKGSSGETYTPESIALIQVSGTGVHNNKALQVEAVATSLNSYDCFLLQSGTSMFLWVGNHSTHEQQELAAKVAEFLKVVSNGVIFDFNLAEIVQVGMV